MRTLALLALCACSPKDDSAAEMPVDTQDSEERDCASADAEPGTTTEGHPSDGWRWEKAGPLFADVESLAYSEGDLAPTMVEVEGTLHLLYTRQRGLEQDLWSSTSSDGVSWTEPVAIAGLPDGEAGYGGMLYDQGLFRLWYGSGSIDYASSLDGLAFEPEGTALTAGESGDFDSLSVLYPNPVGTGDVLALFYTGFDGQAYAIGAAESGDGGATWTKTDLEMERDTDAWDNAAVAQPMVVDQEGTALIWFGGYDTSLTNPGPWRIGFAPGDISERAVSLPLAESGLDAWSTRDPAVVPWGDGWLMVYVGMGDDGVYRLLRATSDVCN